MNSQLDSPTPAPPPKESQPEKARNRKRLIKIKRSSGKYEYVTPEQLEELNKQRKQRHKAQKAKQKRKRFILSAIGTLLILFGAYGLFRQLQNADLSQDEAVLHSEASPLLEEKQTEAVQSTGAIRVLSKIDKATIYVDGEALGQTANGSTIVDEIAVGFHEIMLRKDGYSTTPELIVAQVVADQTTTLKFTLTRVERTSTNPF